MHAHLSHSTMVSTNGLTAANELVQCPSAVSANGTYYSVSSLDGQLHIWDTLSADLVADYTPSSHLSATCVRLSWPPLVSSSYSTNSPTKRRKKQKTSDQDVQDEVARLSLVALGTANGTILLYSVTKSELYSQLANGHTDRVNDIAWHPASDSLFTCSNDKYVIEWSISKSSIKSKHMLDRSVINSVAVVDNKHILTASSSIKWWNWESRQLLKTFNGHSTEVRFLKPLIFGPADGQDNLLLSSAISDRYINTWELNEATNSNSIANFALDDEPISLEVAHTSSSDNVFILSISRSGFLYIFEHLFNNNNQLINKVKSSARNGLANGSLTSPIVPKIRLQILSAPTKSLRASRSPRKSTTQSSAVQQMPFLCAHLDSEAITNSSSAKSNSFLMIGYGSVNRPTFERISYADCEKCYLTEEGILQRTDVAPSQPPAVVQEVNNTKIKSNQSARDTEKTTVIGPAGIAPSQPLFNNFSRKNGTKLNGDIESEDEEQMADDEINNNYVEKKSPTKTPDKKTDKKPESQPQNQEKGKKTNNSEELTLGEMQAQISEEEKAKHKQRKLKRKRDRLASESGGLADQANTDSLVNVLMQGLKSNDTKMLQTVLSSTDETVIRNTIKKLPVSYIPHLMTQLQRGLFKKGDHQSLYLKWINLVMQVKITYLMSSNICNEFQSLNQLLTARTAILDRCYQLKGRLDIVLSQVKSEKRTDRLTQTKPQLTYESDSSESDIEMDDEEEDDEEEDEEELDDAVSMDDHDLMNSDGDDNENSDEEVDEEMYESAPDNEDDDVKVVRRSTNSNDMDADDDSSDDD